MKSTIMLGLMTALTTRSLVSGWLVYYGNIIPGAVESGTGESANLVLMDNPGDCSAFDNARDTFTQYDSDTAGSASFTCTKNDGTTCIPGDDIDSSIHQFTLNDDDDWSPYQGTTCRLGHLNWVNQGSGLYNVFTDEGIVRFTCTTQHGQDVACYSLTGSLILDCDDGGACPLISSPN